MGQRCEANAVTECDQQVLDDQEFQIQKWSERPALKRRAIPKAAVDQKRPEFPSHSQIESLKMLWTIPSASVEIMVIQPDVYQSLFEMLMILLYTKALYYSNFLLPFWDTTAKFPFDIMHSEKK